MIYEFAEAKTAVGFLDGDIHYLSPNWRRSISSSNRTIRSAIGPRLGSYVWILSDGIVAAWETPLFSSCPPSHASDEGNTQDGYGKNSCAVSVGDWIGQSVGQQWDFLAHNHVFEAAIAFFTFGLAWFTAFLWKATLGLLSHAPQVERAYISGGGGPTTQIINQPATAGGFPASTFTVPTGHFTLCINNHGKTPGEMIEYGIGFCDASAIPTMPNYEITHFQGYIAPGTNGHPIAYILMPTAFPRLCVYGRFYYQDIFEDRHSCGFILEIIGGDSRPIVAPAAYTEAD